MHLLKKNGHNANIDNSNDGISIASNNFSLPLGLVLGAIIRHKTSITQIQIFYLSEPQIFPSH
jgi:hypothetical protein